MRWDQNARVLLTYRPKWVSQNPVDLRYVELSAKMIPKTRVNMYE